MKSKHFKYNKNYLKFCVKYIIEYTYYRTSTQKIYWKKSTLDLRQQAFNNTVTIYWGFVTHVLTSRWSSTITAKIHLLSKTNIIQSTYKHVHTLNYNQINCGTNKTISNTATKLNMQTKTAKALSSIYLTYTLLSFFL